MRQQARPVGRPTTYDIPLQQRRTRPTVPHSYNNGIREHQTGRVINNNSNTQAVVHPIEPPQEYPPLDFRPAILRRPVTMAIGCLYVALAVGLSLLATLPDTTTAYPIKQDAYYFGVRYGPGLVAAVSTFLFKNTAQEFLRMLPYFNMANSGGAHARYTVLARYWPTLQTPNSAMTWITSVLLGASSLLISYKSLLLEVIQRETSWEVYIHNSIAIPLIAYYVFLAVYMFALTGWMWGRSTGLRSDWDPQCLADIVNLFVWIDADMGREESLQGGRVLPTIPAEYHDLNYRLGYWSTHDGPDERITYGIRTCKVAGDKAHSRFLGHQCNTERSIQRQGSRRGFHQYLFRPWTSILYWASIVILIAWVVLLSLLLGFGYVWHNFALLDNWSLHRLDHLPDGTLATGAPNITMVPTGTRGKITGGDGSPRMYRLLLISFLVRTLPLIALSIAAI